MMFAQSAVTYAHDYAPVTSLVSSPRSRDKSEAFPLVMIINEGYESPRLFGKTYGCRNAQADKKQALA